jgi:hypothetical protein
MGSWAPAGLGGTIDELKGDNFDTRAWASSTARLLCGLPRHGRYNPTEQWAR